MPTVKRGADCHPARFHWTPELLRLLGRTSDVEVAAQARVSPSTVRLERRRRRIGNFYGQRPRIEWTAPMLSLLGTDTDANVAAKLGIHRGSVTWRRERLHIPAFGPARSGRRSKIHWAPRALSLLGTAPDGEIAKRLRLTWGVVIRKRQQLGIPSFVRPTVRIQWKIPWLRLLGRRPDRELARQLGVRRLGKEPDTKIARELGITSQSVLGKRRALGIPAWSPSKGPRKNG